MIVYNVPKHQAINLVSGRHAVFIADKAMQQTPALLRSNVQPAAIIYRFSQTVIAQSDSFALQGFYFAGKRILVCSQSIKTIRPGKRIRADIVVISGSPRLQLEDLIRAIDCRLLVFDSSNPAWKISEWASACKKAGLACYAVAEKGAFVFTPD